MSTVENYKGKPSDTNYTSILRALNEVKLLVAFLEVEQETLP